MKQNRGHSGWRIVQRQQQKWISEREKPNPAFILKTSLICTEIPKEKCVWYKGLWRVRVMMPEICSWHHEVAKWVLEYVCMEQQVLLLYTCIRNQSCVQMFWRDGQRSMRACLICLTVNSFLLSMERQQLFLGLFAVLMWLFDGSAR